jgi:AcrR family transcriptional regulator
MPPTPTRPTRPGTRDAILAAAGPVLAQEPTAPLDVVAAAAQVSRATFYRHFRSRADLLDALDLEPDPDTRERVLSAAAELIGRDGLARLSMDELAGAAGVSRASVYRLFPGKPALFEAVIVRFAPFRQIIEYLDASADEPPDVVVPGIYRMAAGVAAARIGIVRAVFFEVTSGSDEAMAGAVRPIQAMIASLGGYLARQMDAGHVRRMHPTLAAQLFIGPLLFHLFTRPYAQRLIGFGMPLEEAVDQLASAALRGLASGDPSSPTDPQELVP